MGDEAGYPYHANNAESQGSFGYLGKLDALQEAALAELRARLADSGTSVAPLLCPPAETEAHFLLRFLRARKFNVDAALSMLQDDLAWREQEKIAELNLMSPAEVLGCDPADVVGKYFPYWLHGYDREVPIDA